MNKEKKYYLRIGMLFIVSISMLIFGYNFIKGNNIFTRNYKLYLFIDDFKDEIRLLTPIKMNDVEVGVVNKIETVRGKILLELSIYNNYKINNNASFYLSPQGIFTNSFIYITDVKMNQNYYENRDTIQAKLKKDNSENIIELESDLKDLSLSIGKALIQIGESGTLNLNQVFDTVSQNKIFRENQKEKSTSLNNFLENPLDFQEYKIIKRAANSGGIDNKSIYYKPNYEGIFLRFFLFDNIERGTQIISYRKGKDIGIFEEDRDLLLEIFSIRVDKDLKNANLVGQNIDSIIELYGMPHFKDVNHYYFINENKKLLTLHLRNNKIDWFKWQYLNKNIKTLNDIKNLK